MKNKSRRWIAGAFLFAMGTLVGGSFTYSLLAIRSDRVVELDLQFEDEARKFPSDLKAIETYYLVNGQRVLHGEKREWERGDNRISEEVTRYRHGEVLGVRSVHAIFDP